MKTSPLFEMYMYFISIDVSVPLPGFGLGSQRARGFCIVASDVSPSGSLDIVMCSVSLFDLFGIDVLLLDCVFRANRLLQSMIS
jgi:hypothetical protein